MSTSKSRNIAWRGGLRSPRSIQHSDPRTDRYKKDQREQRERRRAWFHENEREDLDADLPVHERLGLEFELDRAGRELSSKESEALKHRMKEERATYWADRGGKRKGKRRKKPVAEPLEYAAFRLAPWHSMALVDAAAGGHQATVLKHLKAAAAEVVRCLEKTTGFEIVVCPLHPKRFASHFQPSWAKVDAQGELLGTRKGRGTAGKPVYLGPKLLGAWRLREAGYDLAKFTMGGGPNSALNLDKAIASRRAGGQEPLDLEISKVLDSYFGALENDSKLKLFFTRAKEHYRSFKTKEQLAIMEHGELRSQVETLRAELDKERAESAKHAATALGLARDMIGSDIRFVGDALAAVKDRKATREHLKWLDASGRGPFALKKSVREGLELLRDDPALGKFALLCLAMDDNLRTSEKARSAQKEVPTKLETERRVSIGLSR